MKKAMQWIGRNLSMGGLVRNISCMFGNVAKHSLNGVGTAASLLTDKPDSKQRIKDVCSMTGNSLDSALKKGGTVAGDGINKGVQLVSSACGATVGGIARKAGASDENVDLAKKVGTIAGAVGVGVVAGAGIVDMAVALGAAAGTAGAAATTSGLATLGGGSIAVGGGGIAVGQAVTQGIVAAGGVSGAASITPHRD